MTALATLPDLTTREGQLAHYAATRARLRGPVTHSPQPAIRIVASIRETPESTQREAGLEVPPRSHMAVPGAQKNPPRLSGRMIAPPRPATQNRSGVTIYARPVGPFADARPESDIACSNFPRIIMLNQGVGAVIAQIIFDVCREYAISENEMMSTRRDKAIVGARQMAMYRVSQATRASLPEIGRKFGKDHTTVLYAIRRVKAMLASREAAP